MSKRLIFIFSALAVAVSYLFFVEPHLKSTTEKLLSKNALWVFPRGSLREISFGDISILRNKDGAFRIEKPVSAAASEETCLSLFLKWERVVPVTKFTNSAKDGEKLSDYQLDPPALIVRFKFWEQSAGEQIKILLIGKKVEGQGTEYYARLEEEKIESESSILLLKSDLVESLQKPLAEYADSKPFSFLKEGSAEIHWRTEDRLPCMLKCVLGLFLISNETFTWQAENHLSRSFISEFQNFDIMTGTPMSDKDAGITKPWCTIIVTGVVADAIHSKEMLVGKTIQAAALEGKKSRWVKFEPDGLAYPLEENVLKYLDLDFEKLAARNTMDGPVIFLKQVIFDFHEKKTQLVFTGEKMNWNLEHRYAWLFQSPKVFNYILKFVTREVSHFRMGNLTDPVLTVQFEYKDSAMPKEKVDIYRVKDNPAICYVQRNGAPTIAEMPASILDEMSDDPFQFVGKNLMEQIVDKSSKLVIRKVAQEFLLQKNNLGIWQSTESNGPTPDALLDGLRKVECYSSMLKRDGVDFGFSPPVSQITFFGENDKKLLDCKIGSYSSKNESFLLVDDLFFMFVRQFPEEWIAKS